MKPRFAWSAAGYFWAFPWALDRQGLKIAWVGPYPTLDAAWWATRS